MSTIEQYLRDQFARGRSDDFVLTIVSHSPTTVSVAPANAAPGDHEAVFTVAGGLFSLVSEGDTGDGVLVPSGSDSTPASGNQAG